MKLNITNSIRLKSSLKAGKAVFGIPFYKFIILDKTNWAVIEESNATNT